MSSVPFEIIHFDVCGLAPFVFKGDNRYYVLFVDDYSWYTWVYIMYHHSQFLSIYQSFVAMVHT